MAFLDPISLAAMRLLFDAGVWVWENVINAEKNGQLDSGNKKHIHVKQVCENLIDCVDIRERDEFKELTDEEIEHVKSNVKKQLPRKITKAVDTMRDKGMFVKGK